MNTQSHRSPSRALIRFLGRVFEDGTFNQKRYQYRHGVEAFGSNRSSSIFEGHRRTTTVAQLDYLHQVGVHTKPWAYTRCCWTRMATSKGSMISQLAFREGRSTSRKEVPRRSQFAEWIRILPKRSRRGLDLGFPVITQPDKPFCKTIKIEETLTIRSDSPHSC